MVDTQNDNVNNPKHYQTDAGIEAIEVIEAFFPNNVHFANAFKYLARAGKKDSLVEDVEKAIWYLERFLDTQVRYEITEKGKAVAELSKAGIEWPLAKRIAYRGPHGYTWELGDDGEWHQVGVWQNSVSTQVIIKALKANENARLVDLDIVDDADVVFRSVAPREIKKLKDAGIAGDWDDYWYEDSEGRIFHLEETGFWENVNPWDLGPLSTEEVIDTCLKHYHGIYPVTPEKPERTLPQKLHAPQVGDYLADERGELYEYFDDGDYTGWGCGFRRTFRKSTAGTIQLPKEGLRQPTEEEADWLKNY